MEPLRSCQASGDPRRRPMVRQQASKFVIFDLPYLYPGTMRRKLMKRSVASPERVIAYEGPRYYRAILLEGEIWLIRLPEIPVVI